MAKNEFIGEEFQELTKYSPTGISGGHRPERSAAPFKEDEAAETVSLAGEELPEGSLWSALLNRRSRRAFTNEPIGKSTLARLVWACQGATAGAGGLVLRTAPSAGALYPVETYLVINRVTGIKPGLYHYRVRRAELGLIKPGDHGPELAAAALGQNMCAKAPAVFLWTAIVDRCKFKYAQRAYRYLYLDAGHICQNLYLAAEDLGLGCCSMGAFFDDQVNRLLGVDGQAETILYLAAVGPVKEGRE